jgi:ribosomal protein L21E
MTKNELMLLIQAGTFDASLNDIQDAIENRLKEIRVTRTVDQYGVGDTVIFNDLTGTKYVQGHTAKVVGKSRTKLLVKLETPVGRFGRMVDGKLESVEIKVPPSIVDLVTAS